MIVNFGATGVTGNDCPAGGNWNEWCDCAFPPNADISTNVKCKSWRPGAPWTVVGAMLRGIPQLGGDGAGSAPSSILSTITSLFTSGSAAASQGAPVAAPTDDGIFGVPKVVALVGGGILVAGAGAFLLSRRKAAPSGKKKPAMAGHGRRRRTRRR